MARGSNSAPRLTDSHCHLDDRQFDADREAMIERARNAGIQYLLSIGTGDGPPDLGAAIRLADRYEFVYATVGVHPNDADKLNSNTFRNLESLVQHPKVVAVGEIGLDYHWGVPKEIQTPLFERQLALAKECRKPIVIHTRDAWEDTMEVLERDWSNADLPCVMHCFTGTVEQAERCLRLGFYLSFGGVTTFPNAAQVREAAKITPVERMLLETDCPYLAPKPHRGKRNEPSLLVHTAAAIAEVKELGVEELAEATTRNFERLFLSGPTQ